MQLDRTPMDPLVGQELEDLLPLIALELDDSTHILIFYQCSVACKFLVIITS